MNNDKKNGSNLGPIIAVILFIVLAFSSCSDSGSSRRNVAYDPDGFLGYSDSFWDWYVEHN